MHKAGYYPLQKKVPILRAEAKSTKRGPPKPALTRQGKFLSNAPLRSWGAGQRKYNSPLPHFAGHLSPLHSCRTPSNGTSGGEVFLNPFFHFLSLTYQSYLLVYLCSFTCTYALVNFSALYRFNSTSSSTCVYSSSPHLPFIFPPSLSSPHSLDLMRLTHHILLLSVYAPLSSRHFLTCKKRKNTINLYNHFQEKATVKN